MNLKWFPLIAAAMLVGFTAHAQQSELVIGGLDFVDHLKAGMIEQDVYVERIKGSGKVYRVTVKQKETYINAPIYTTASSVHHAPFAMDKTGPYKRGKKLGFTLGQWLSGTGKASYSCKAGQGKLTASFEKLVPHGLYTMWYAYAVKRHMGCAKCPFATLDFPVGKPDGTQNIFYADGMGNARYQASFKPCIELGSGPIMAMLAIAYHSDGKTYGPSPGPMGSVAHVQLFTGLPGEGAHAMATK